MRKKGLDFLQTVNYNSNVIHIPDSKRHHQFQVIYRKTFTLTNFDH